MPSITFFFLFDIVPDIVIHDEALLTEVEALYVRIYVNLAKSQAAFSVSDGCNLQKTPSFLISFT